MLKGRLVRQLGGQHILFEIHGYNKSMNQFTASRVYDSNGILFLRNLQRNIIYFDPETILNQMHVLDEEEEKKEREEMQSIRHVLHVGYYTQSINYYNSCIEILLPQTSVPKLDDYIFHKEPKHLKSVDHSDLIPVKF